MVRTALAVIGAVLLTTLPVSAQGVQLEFQNGYVSLSARDATAPQILAEWARLGGTRVVNADRVPGGPMTLELERVPEGRALETILRTASGYVVAPRSASEPGASAFERIMVMPPSTAARVTGPPPAMPPPPPFPTQPQPVDPNAEPLTDDQGQPVEAAPGFEPDYDDPEPPSEPGRRPFVPGMRGGVDPAVSPEPVEEPPEPEPADPGPVPVNPGTLTSPTPGVLPIPERQQRPQ